MDGSPLSPDADLRVGRIIAVSASQAIVLLEIQKGEGDSGSAWPLEMGTLVKVRTRPSTVFGLVTGLRVPLPSLEP